MTPRLWAIVAFAFLLLQAPALGARPGGGQYYGGDSSPSYSPSPPSNTPSNTPSYSPSSPGSSDYGSSDSDDSGGSGDGVAVLFALIWMCFKYPPLGLAVLAIVVVVSLIQRREAKRWQNSWESGVIAPARSRAAPKPSAPTLSPSARVRGQLERDLRAIDPEFSLVLFEDFLYALYSAFHEARGGSQEIDVRPYVRDQAERFLRERRCADIRHVVVGSLEYTSTSRTKAGSKDWIMVAVSFESNLTEVREDGHEQAYYIEERWRLAREVGAKSRPPERTSLSECAHCGGALSEMRGNVCAYCDKTLTPGAFDWAVGEVRQVRREERGPMLTGETAERGTDLPTLVDPVARTRYAKLCARDPAFDWDAFEKRVGVIFTAMQKAWTDRDWKLVRPYLSDQLFQMQLYWIDEYKRQKLVNRTDGARLLETTLAKVTGDKHFDSLTVRIFASGLDYTETEDGRLRSGSRTIPRKYTEYWTFIRGASVSKPPTTEPECPHCGAELDVNMAGNCSYCRLKVTRGDFDWVLSRIEQDEAYGG